ncbi:MAG: hypothetical protein ACK5QC_07730 [Bacteroidota bacterium]
MLSYFKKNYQFKLVLSLVIISVTWVNFNHVFWVNQNVINHDVNHYYSYLPAFFYEKDLKLNFLNDTNNIVTEGRYYSPKKTPENGYVIKMSMGMAVSYLPFFGLAHAYAQWSGDEVNGFSPPYHFALQFSTLIYFLIGLYFLWKFLLLNYSKLISAVTILLICFGTNVFFYLTFRAALSHIIGFTGIAMLMYYSQKWHQNPSSTTSIKIGLLIGFLTLVRPINLLAVIPFLLYNFHGLNSLKSQIYFFVNQKINLLIIGFTAFLVVLPQLLYWHYATGHFFFNSYVEEGFYFSEPHVIKALFGFRKGWLIYTPIMLLSLIGIWLIYKTKKSYFYSILIFTSIYIYVAFSWWCWWYGGSYGQRVMIDIYPILALPLAAFLHWVSDLKKFPKKIWIIAISALTLLNLFQTTQAKFNIIHYDSMTFDSYVKAFGVMTNNNEIKKLLQKPDYENALKGEVERELPYLGE